MYSALTTEGGTVLPEQYSSDVEATLGGAALIRRLRHMTDHNGAEVLDEMDGGREVLGRWDASELIRSCYPALGFFALTPFLPKRVQLLSVTLSIASLAVAGAVLGVEAEHETASEFVAKRTRWLTRQPAKLHARQSMRDDD